ncbi:MAG: hypothetical protein JKY09_05880, partial [Crocinitomicaceae bacterium]|nr:hypothetical protein [Crocinitomicaceae bacterium]
MKATLLFTCALVTGVSFAQTTIDLTINHEFGGAPFAYNTNYLTDDGKAVSFD